jgi:capsular exopolysaccharide synthesis family protein
MVVAQTEEAQAVVDQNSAPAVGSDRSDWLRRSNGSQPLAVNADNRDWLFPGVDEVFRGIYTRAGLGFSSEVVAVCSSITGEGKTTVSVGLGVTLAQDFPDSRILIVETDLKNPVLAADFAVAPNPGLVDCMYAGAPVQDAYRPTFLENLHVVPVGGPLQGAGRVLRSIHMASAMDAMRQTHDIIILDVPPILVNSDAVLLTDLTDGIICVVRTGATPVDIINKGISQLDADKLRGVVLNGADSAVPGWIRRLWAE